MVEVTVVGFDGLVGVSQMKSVSVLQRNSTNGIYIYVYIQRESEQGGGEIENCKELAHRIMEAEKSQDQQSSKLETQES